ncbi:MAG: tRNA (adenosine(37)-N6)-threonylcarbamoyltransferase complex transferase subunit TsaD [Candidatus Obscuribacterales bacterium]|nr:tRNA (adenosine(37)-N6)-threonylcarbamoyltransferase complex transferase subunit TsaD [Candidatus Obscuribacterales bacterium]
MSLILGIETSCDETAAAIVEDGRKVLSSRVHSQTEIHEQFGGVVPEVAARYHLESINKIIDQAIEAAGVSRVDLTAIACANGPGLIGTLLVGLSAAKAMSWAWSLPLLTVDHLLAHVCANYIDSELEPPFVCLLVSGGHTQLLHFDDYEVSRLMGETLDDAAGEAYDKVARLLALGYPGGPAIDRISANGNPRAYRFPEGVVDNYNFSFSGLKTAVLRTVEKIEKPLSEEAADLAASFQDAVNRVLFKKTVAAAIASGVKQIVLAGGVAANTDLRSRFDALDDLSVFMPSLRYCTDNAAMVAAAAHFMGVKADLSASVYSRSKKKTAS